jgi:hypothetical protein
VHGDKMKKLLLAVAILLSSQPCLATTYTAASCSRADVQAAVNLTSNGDTVVIPVTGGTTCTWTAGVTVSGKGIDITGTGTPNTGGGTFGAGTPNTTLVDNVAAGTPYYGALFTFTGLTFGQTAKVELLIMSASGAAANSVSHGPINFSGTCTSSGCPEFRVDNINFTANTWESALAGSGFVTVGNMFGVVDHTTTVEAVSGSPPLAQVAFPSWNGVGDWGDNSFATADTFGTVQAVYIENNSMSGVRGSDNDVGTPTLNVGGERFVCRFNTIANMSGTGGCGGPHGTAWGGRFRGIRQNESYYNTVTSLSSSGCDTIDGLLSGTGYYLSNSVNDSTFTCSAFLSLEIARFAQNSAPWNACDGTQPWDQSPWNSTTSACLDQPGSGAGAAGSLFTNQNPPTLASSPSTPCSTSGQCWPNPALDPVYQAGEFVTGGSQPFNFITVNGGSSATRVVANVNYYAEVSMTAQTSATSPFNGTTGTGYGTLARRPTTCTTGVGYWATDTGTWNTYNSQQGTLYKCSSTNTWSTLFTPYTYPHPLETTSGSVTLSCALPGPSFGSVVLTNSSTGSTCTVTNNSSTNATSVTPTTTGTNAGDFVVSGSTCGTVTASGGTCTFTETFTPGAIGSRTAIANVAYSGGDGASPVQQNLSGTGVSQIGQNVTSIAFGNVTDGTTAPQQTVTLTNNGSTSVTSNVLSLTGANAGLFTIVVPASGTNCNTTSTLTASSSCVAAVTFSPVAVGSFTATLNFTNSATGSPQTVSLTGSGIAAPTQTSGISFPPGWPF